MADESDNQIVSSAPDPEIAAPGVNDGRLTRGGFLKAAAATTAAVAASQAAAGVIRAAAPAVVSRAGSVQLTFWHYFPELRPGFQKVFDAFHADFPSITINQVPKPVNSWDQVLDTAMAAGVAPDLFIERQPTLMPPQAKSGQLLDLTGHVPNIANALQIARDVNYYNGKLYDVTWGRYTLAMMYNKRLLGKLGLRPPTNWDDWLAQCKKIKAAGMTAIANSGDGNIDAFMFIELATAALGRKGFDDLLTGKKKFTAPELVETMKFIVALEPYYQTGFLATKYADAKALFATEKAVYFEAGSADVPGFLSINPNLEIGVFPFPPPHRGGTPVTLSGLSATTAASSATKAPQACYEFMNWCLSPKGSTLCSAAISLSPVVKGVAPKGDKILDEIIAFSQNDYPVWYERPSIAPGFNIWATQGQGVFTGRLTSMQLLQQMQQQADLALKGKS